MRTEIVNPPTKQWLYFLNAKFIDFIKSRKEFNMKIFFNSIFRTIFFPYYLPYTQLKKQKNPDLLKTGTDKTNSCIGYVKRKKDNLYYVNHF